MRAKTNANLEGQGEGKAYDDDRGELYCRFSSALSFILYRHDVGPPLPNECATDPRPVRLCSCWFHSCLTGRAGATAHRNIGRALSSLLSTKMRPEICHCCAKSTCQQRQAQRVLSNSTAPLRSTVDDLSQLATAGNELLCFFTAVFDVRFGGGRTRRQGE